MLREHPADETLHLPAALRLLRSFDFPHKLGICDRLFGRRLSERGIAWVDTAAGVRWKLDLRNATHRWIVYGDYEGPGFLRWARQTLPGDATIIDAGANIGQMVLYLARLAPRGRIFAFEPGTAAREWLCACLATTTFPVEVVACALGEKSERLRLRSEGPITIHGAWNQVSTTDGEEIQVVPLDAFVESRAIHRIDLWKLDVEGHELPALRGAERLLGQQRIRALHVELTASHAQEVIRFLESLRYRLYLNRDSGRLFVPSSLPDHTNGLFLPES